MNPETRVGEMRFHAEVDKSRGVFEKEKRLEGARRKNAARIF